MATCERRHGIGLDTDFESLDLNTIDGFSSSYIFWDGSGWPRAFAKRRLGLGVQTHLCSRRALDFWRWRSGRRDILGRLTISWNERLIISNMIRAFAKWIKLCRACLYTYRNPDSLWNCMNWQLHDLGIPIVHVRQRDWLLLSHVSAKSCTVAVCLLDSRSFASL